MTEELVNLTIEKIAKKTGYGRGTVSRVLNRHPNVKESTRKNILKVVEELNFSPNAVARSLTLNKTDTIGLIIPCLWNPFFGELVHHLEIYARLKSFDLILSVTEYTIEMELNSLRTLMSRKVDAVLIWAYYQDKRDKLFLELEKSNIPFVILGYPAPVNVNYVAVDREAGVRIGVEHLIKLGHKRIAYIGRSMYPHDDKFIGYKKAMEEFGLEIRDDFVIICEHALKGGYESAKKILELTPRPSAIFTASDIIALGLVNGLKKIGVNVPEDIAIVSFDDIEEAGYAEVPLTTIHQPKKEMAESAINIILESLKCKQEDRKVLPLWQNLIEPKIMIRESCGMRLSEFSKR